MDHRPAVRRTRDHHHRRSHLSSSNATNAAGMKHGQQQQQLTSGEGYSSTESDCEGAAVYESLAPTTQRQRETSQVSGLPRSVTGEFPVKMYSTEGRNSRRPGPESSQFNSIPADSKVVKSTNLDDLSPLPQRKEFSTANANKAQLYELLKFSPEAASPETDDAISQTSNEHNVSDCPTMPVHEGSSQTGSYLNPSSHSDFSSLGISPQSMFQSCYGVQQLSAQHLHHPYLTSPIGPGLSSHMHHSHPHHRQSIYGVSSHQDSHYLDDPHQHCAASSPTTTANSDRCLLPTSSSGNICKSSHNNSVILTDPRHLFGTSMHQPASHPHHIDRPLSEHYLSNSILRQPQCPLHQNQNGGFLPQRTLTNLRSTSTNKSVQKKRGLRSWLTWRNFSIGLGILCLALAAALAYFAVAIGSQRQDESIRCSRAQEVISSSIYNNGPVSKGPKYNYKNLYPDEEQSQELHHDSSFTSVIVPARSFWLGRIVQKQPENLSFNLTISPSATLVFYGRRNLPPSHAEYDFVHRIRRTARTVRDATDANMVKTFHENLDMGIWFIALFNDQSKDESVRISIVTEGEASCSSDCNGQGACIDGKCQCITGFGGDDCSQAVCPVLCSGRGKYAHGTCQCFPGWKGSDCGIPEFQCDDPTCSGRGRCTNGKCSCDPGFSGNSCETVECPKECSSHGICVKGSCFCQPGWLGVVCDVPVTDSRRLCSNHGSLSAATQKCVCDPRWSGDGCSVEICTPMCGTNGHCNNSMCVCEAGWTGPTCENPECPPCGPNGKCVNGSCVCAKMWSGKLCTKNDCPNDCSGHGSCLEIGKTSWKCECEAFWKGDGCETPMERCDDKKDNDGDGLVDCDDNDCCQADVCAENVNCLAAPEPKDVLLREQAPSDSASFYDRVRFLIRDNGVQNFADRDAFDPKRVSVLRGKVIDVDGVGLVGVRVSVQTVPTETQTTGFTLSRKDGMFDLMVNGGGSQTIVFQKSGYRRATTSLAVGWNEFSVVEATRMLREGEAPRSRLLDLLTPGASTGSSCVLPGPLPQVEVYPFWQHFPSGGLGSSSVVYQDAQVLQESLNISGSALQLNHFSSRTSGFASLLLIVLTKNEDLKNVTKITVKISNAGLQEETSYDAEKDLSHVYAWDGFNAYKQLVYGFSNAKVSIGYEMVNCKDTYWTHQMVKMKGVDLPVSGIGGWDLSIQHRYNAEGVLHRGDGSSVYFSEGLLEVAPAVGSGQIRPVVCNDGCAAGLAKDIDLLAPIALATAPDGSLYVGDFNLIRKVKPDGALLNVLQLQSPAMLQKYFMAVNPTNGKLYISIAQSLKVIRVTTTDTAPTDLSNNYDVVAGNGLQCFPKDGQFKCGDGVAATTASMMFPKGVAFDKEGNLYILDGSALRVVDPSGIIRTIIPPTTYTTCWAPLPCQESLHFSSLSLKWPSSIAVSPVDDSVVIIDDGALLKLDIAHRTGQIIAGHSAKCPSESSLSFEQNAGLAISSDGVVYFTQTSKDEWSVSRVKRGKVVKMLSSNIPVSKNSEKMQLPTSLAVGSNARLFLADVKAVKVFSVGPNFPKQNAKMEYVVEAPEKGELYIFDRYGHHMETRDILTNNLKFKFAYTVETAFGKVRSITDGEGKTCMVERDYKGQVKSIDCGGGWKTTFTNTMRGWLKEVTYGDGLQVTMAYDAENGLLTGRTDSRGNAFSYKYDSYGRLSQVVYPNGQRTEWSSETAKVAKRLLESSLHVQESDHGKVSLFSPLQYTLSLDSRSNVPHTNGTVPASLLFRGDNDTSIKMDLAYSIRSDQPFRVRRMVSVNDSALYGVDFTPATNEEVLVDREGNPIFSTKLNAAGKIVSTKPTVGDFLQSSFAYDNMGRMTKWEQGQRWMTMTYNEQSLPAMKKTASGQSWKFEYNEKRKLAKITKGSGGQILIDYDTFGGVKAIKTPKGATLMMKEDPMAFFRRYSIREAQSEVPFSQDYNDDGLLIAQTFPSGMKALSNRYDTQGRLTDVFFGRNTIDYNYGRHGKVEKIVQQNDELKATTEVSYFSGMLVEGKHSSYEGPVELESVGVKYEYGDGFVLRRRKVQVGNSDVSVTDIQTNPATRQLTKFGPFSMSQSQVGTLIVSDDNAIFMKQLNNMGKTRNSVLRLQQRIVASVEMSYNEDGALAETKLRKGESEPQLSFSMKYDVEGRLVEVLKNKQPWWNSEYDANGNTVKMGGSSMKNFTYGNKDELIGLHIDTFEVQIVSDEDGFVTKKGDLNFEYDGRGQLVRITKDGSMENVRYFYDEEGRLMARQASPNDIVQFIYGDLKETTRVTHLYQKRTRTLTQLFYDGQGQLMAMARDGNPYYILQSPLSVTIFSNQAKVVKEVFYSPFDHVESDSSPDFYYPFDHDRNVRDAQWGSMVFVDQRRPYLPQLGRYLTPDFGDLREMSLAKLNPYVFQANDPLLTPEEKQPILNVDGWMDALGFSSSVTFSNGLAFRELHDLSCDTRSPLPLLNHTCTLHDAITPFTSYSINSATSSALFDALTTPLRFSSSLPFYGKNILLTRNDADNTTVVVTTGSGPRAVNDAMENLLGGSYILPWRVTSEAKVGYLVVKKGGVATLDLDISKLRTALAAVNFTTKREVNDVSLLIQSEVFSMNVTYSSDVKKSTEALKDGLMREAVKKAWEDEKRRVGSNGKSTWTENEKLVLKTKGSVPGYSGRFIKDVEAYPELASDPANVLFVRA
ncbi:hypothetical protein RvY_11793-2 [Ramazzottius varieornatus]|uniref:EGF-like domain-containing protein n=1 Tax=Ramazzottius varieornatus TaxID=947166 RepID=A0A1D1VJP2_RAMVA|nr:hypothetical protein RvY_11793-2 [Ramazzottius varieornatus]